MILLISKWETLSAPKWKINFNKWDHQVPSKAFYDCFAPTRGDHFKVFIFDQFSLTVLKLNRNRGVIGNALIVITCYFH